MDHDGSRANHRPIPHSHGTKNQGVRSDIHVVSENRQTLSWQSVADRDPLPEEALGAYPRLGMNHQTRAMLERKTWTDVRTVVDLDTHDPMDDQHIKAKKRRPEDPGAPGKPPDPLAKPEEQGDKPPLGAALIGFPVLEKSCVDCVFGDHAWVPWMARRVAYLSAIMAGHAR